MVAEMSGAGAPTRPPASIEDLMWNLHCVLVAVPGPLNLDNLRDAYAKRLGHRCAIERFLVVSEAGLAVTFKRIPHIVTLFQSDGATCVKATQAPETTKQQLIDADAAYRKELIKKNAQAKAANAAKAKPGGASPAAAGAAASPAKAASPAPVASPAAAGKRPADAPAGAEAKKAKTDGDNTLTRMLVQGVVRVLQNRQKADKGPLPMSELESEFKALWKVPFNLEQAKEKDPVSFLQGWPGKVEVYMDGGAHYVKLASKPQEKAAPAAPAAVPPAVAKPPPAVAKTPPATTGAPTPAPASILDFLFNLHTVLETAGENGLPIDQLKDTYSKQLGHKFAIERFLVVGDAGIAVTLKRIPHVVTIITENSLTVLKATQPTGSTKEMLVEADKAYRQQLAQRSAAAKSAAVAKSGGAAKAKAPPAAAEAPAAEAKIAKAAPAPPAAPAAAPAPKKPAAEEIAGAPDAKKPRTEDADTLARMLVQGIARVLQNRAKEGKGPLPIANLEEEFKALWKVPFSLQQAGETDAVAFLQKWPNKVEVTNDGTQHLVSLAKKAAEKAKPTAQKASAQPPPQKAAVAAGVADAPAGAVASAAAAEETAAPTAVASAETSTAASGAIAAVAPQALQDIRRQAAEMLQTMEDMTKRQRSLVDALAQLGS